MGASQWVHLDVDEIVRETADAFLIRYRDDEIWIPKSQVADAGDYQEGDENLTLSVTEWIAKKKNLET